MAFCMQGMAFDASATLFACGVMNYEWDFFLSDLDFIWKWNEAWRMIWSMLFQKYK